MRDRTRESDLSVSISTWVEVETVRGCLSQEGRHEVGVVVEMTA